MSDRRQPRESFGDLESLVRAAGAYVQPSRDLRPRVLEAARLESGELKARRHIGRLALCAALFAMLTISGAERPDSPGMFHQWTLIAAEAHVDSATGARARGDNGWSLVEAYTELRRRQAEVLRL
jgi:hypothetical protein